MTQESELVLQLVDKIKPILRGHDPSVQGCALCELLSLWLAGHAPDLRDEVLRIHLEQLNELVKLNEKLLFGERGHPGAIAR